MTSATRWCHFAELLGRRYAPATAVPAVPSRSPSAARIGSTSSPGSSDRSRFADRGEECLGEAGGSSVGAVAADHRAAAWCRLAPSRAAGPDARRPPECRGRGQRRPCRHPQRAGPHLATVPTLDATRILQHRRPCDRRERCSAVPAASLNRSAPRRTADRTTSSCVRCSLVSALSRRVDAPSSFRSSCVGLSRSLVGSSSA